MNKKTIFIIFFLVISKLSFGQYDPAALEILEGMSKKYQQITAFKADIVYSLVNETEGVNDNFKGNVIVKGDKYKLIMDEQEIVNNGETVWTYLPDVNEVTIDNYNPETAYINPTKILNAYKKGFKYLYLNDVSEDGNTYQLVDLVPENAKDSQYFKIRLEVNKGDQMLKSWTMFDKSGNRYVYNVENFSSDINPDDSLFTFDPSKYKDIEIIDLR